MRAGAGSQRPMESAFLGPIIAQTAICQAQNKNKIKNNLIYFIFQVEKGSLPFDTRPLARTLSGVRERLVPDLPKGAGAALCKALHPE